MGFSVDKDYTHRPSFTMYEHAADIYISVFVCVYIFSG